MMFVSDFADQAVMLPLAVVVTVGLGVVGWWRGLAAWLVGVGGTFFLVLLLKAGFFALAADFGSDYQVSPSGHVASACVVYGGLSVLLLQGVAPRWVIAAIPVLAATVIGATRIGLGVHSPVEVVIGGVLGLAGVTMLAAACGPRPRFAAWPLTAAGCVTILGLHGMHLQAEEAIRFASSNW